MARIKATPTDALSYDPNEEKYWDPDALDAELLRAFDICDGCRLCFNLCGSFPALFEAAERANHHPTEITAEEKQQVIDLCFGCKLCYVKCPYTADEGHEFNLDFPALILRARAQKVRAEGLPIRERLLGDPDLLGKVAGLAPGLANHANRAAWHRRLMERFAGIHRDKLLPEFASETFEEWARREGLPPDPVEPRDNVALFFTCFVNFNRPGPGRATVEVLARNEVALRCPEQNCCGMPALDQGDIERACKQAERNVQSLLPWVRGGWRVGAINPTCALMLRKEAPRLLGTPEAAEVGEAVVDPHEVLFDLKRKKRFDRDFASSPGVIGYHTPCHLMAMGRGFRSRDLMRLIPEARIEMVDSCCGHDGTWAMKTEYFEASMEVGAKAFDRLRAADADTLATDCPLAAVQFEQALGTRPMHPMEVLAAAYRPDGFPLKLEPEPPAAAPAEPPPTPPESTDAPDP